MLDHTETSILAIETSIADDKIKGIEGVAKEIGESYRRTAYLLENALIPCGKIGGVWVGSKAVLRKWFAERAATNPKVEERRLKAEAAIAAAIRPKKPGSGRKPGSRVVFGRVVALPSEEAEAPDAA